MGRSDLCDLCTRTLTPDNPGAKVCLRCRSGKQDSELKLKHTGDTGTTEYLWALGVWQAAIKHAKDVCRKRVDEWKEKEKEGPFAAVKCAEASDCRGFIGDEMDPTPEALYKILETSGAWLCQDGSWESRTREERLKDILSREDSVLDSSDVEGLASVIMKQMPDVDWGERCQERR